ncbi:hypothetical protein KQI82_13600 [Oscillibacter sp. MSJ-2]|uniref:Glycosyl-4,4'-diaponeurosporenoate acyltransferase n=1 Tax=Dysosmobacter acutus TaxID=2841504 RepID=A0ABS6FE80_9FIRM|nr:hypothetical protein [Dysosmobacter acutus]
MRSLLKRQIGHFVLTVAAVGVFMHFFGESLPRDRFHYDRFPYRSYSWEENGKFYTRLKIEKWKDRLPDKSRFVKSTVRKKLGGDRSAAHLLRLVQETCVAELTHWLLLVVSPVMLVTMEPPLSIWAAALYGISNLPFIMIQRYNRPRLARLYQTARRREGGTS